MDPRRLEVFADQPYIATRAASVLGPSAPGAETLRRSRARSSSRNTGRRFERFDEDRTRAHLHEGPHPGVEAVLGREAPSAGWRGVPEVEHAALLDGPLSGPWPALKFQREFYSLYHTRGPTLEGLALDPGPRYVLSHSHSHAPLAAPNLLSVTRAVHEGFGQEGGDEGAPAAHNAASSEVSRKPGYAAAGAGSRGRSLQLNGTAARQAALSSADSRYAADATVGTSWDGSIMRPGAQRVGLEVTPVGSNVAIVTSVDAALTRGTLLGQARPGDGGTYADYRMSGGIVSVAEGVGKPGSGAVVVHSVLHPLDAFPGTRRVLLEEATAHEDAERFRRGVAHAALKRKVVTQAMHPHGVLGVDSHDNVHSAVYGDVAAARAAAASASLAHAARREAALAGVATSSGRRGYDFLAPGLEGGRAAASARSAARDGVTVSFCGRPCPLLPLLTPSLLSCPQIMDSKGHSEDLVGASIRALGGTARVVLSEPMPQPGPRHEAHVVSRRANLVAHTTGAFDPITGGVPAVRRAVQVAA
jgi:hypothetical protein